MSNTSIFFFILIISQIIAENPQLPQVPLQLSAEFLYCQGRIYKDCHVEMIQFDGVKKRSFSERQGAMGKIVSIINNGTRIFVLNQQEKICEEVEFSPVPSYWKSIPFDKVQK